MRGNSRMPRLLTALALGLSVTGMALAACSGPLDPTPPDPLAMPKSEPAADARDASDDAP
jgi:hypothetical protein